MGRDERGSLKYAAALFLAATLTISGQAGASKPLVSPSVMAKASKVAICEEGGWSRASDARGPKYFGNLGWLDATWLMFRSPGDPRYMTNASPQRQARAMNRFARRYGWPDQSGCTGSY